MKFLLFLTILALFLNFQQVHNLSVNNNSQDKIEKSSPVVLPESNLDKHIKSVDFLKKVVKIDALHNNSSIPVNVIKNPVIEIAEIDTQILIKKDKSEGEILEKVKFVLKDGVFSSIVRKVSLGGTSDRQYAFKLASSDLRLTGAKVINNCFESNAFYEHPYVCVIANFAPIDALENFKTVEIEYEYISENILRKREKPFTNKEEENVVVWIYDNYKRENAIENINLQITFENRFDTSKMIIYPEKFLLKKENDENVVISWNARELKQNAFKNFALNIPIFNSACKGMNEVHLEITTYSIIQFFIWLTIAIIMIIIITYIYINKKEQKGDNENAYNTEQSVSQEHINNITRIENSK